jgi:hypothetical protein
VQAFPCVVFGDAPLEIVGMASIEFAGGCFTFEDVGIIHKDKKIAQDRPPSVARKQMSHRPSSAPKSGAMEGTILRPEPSFRAEDGEIDDVWQTHGQSRFSNTFQIPGPAPKSQRQRKILLSKA